MDINIAILILYKLEIYNLYKVDNKETYVKKLCIYIIILYRII